MPDVRLDLVPGYRALSAEVQRVLQVMAADAAGADSRLEGSEFDTYARATSTFGTLSAQARDFLKTAFLTDSTLVMGVTRGPPHTLEPRRAANVIATDPAANGERSLSLTAAGDLLLHDNLQRAAAAMGSFDPLLSHVAAELGLGDLTLANLETPTARDLTARETRDARGRYVAVETTLGADVTFDGRAYTGYPAFNAHPRWLASLATAGVTTVTTANNHAADRSSNGIDRTLDALDTAHLAHAGTARYDATRATMPLDARCVITETNGVRVGVLSYTFAVNRGRRDRYNQVSLLSQRQVVADVRALRASGTVDVLIVAPHWGTELANTPSAAQRTLARAALDAGADAVIGAHPHVLQPVEGYRTRDGRNTLIAFSLGNLVADQSSTDPQTRESAILHVDFSVTASGERHLNRVSYAPIELAPTLHAPTDTIVRAPILVGREAHSANVERNIERSLRLPAP